MIQHRDRTALSVLVTVILCAGSSAQTITGTVVTSAAVPVAGAIVHFSGDPAPADATTAANGTFSAPVTAGIYTVDVEPPVTTLAPKRVENVLVTTGTTALGTMVLAPGIVLTGHVQTQAGVPVVNGDTDVLLAATGQKIYTPNDNTDAAGNFSVIVAAGTYRVEADAPAGQLLVSQQSAPFTVLAPMSMGTVVLPPGVAFSGTVKNAQTLALLQNVDIDLDDMVTGVRVITPTDKTDATGFFSVVVPPGLYRVAFDPPRGMAVVGAEIYNFQIPGTLNVGNVLLQSGFVVSGTVLSPSGQPVFGADIDVENTLGGVKVYTPNDSTIIDGTFKVAVPAGTFKIKVAPPASPLLAPAITNPIAVSAPTTVSPITLATGYTLSGTVIGWNGAGEKFARLDVLNPTTGAELFTPGDVATVSGAYSIVVPAGTWNVRIRPDHTTLSRTTTFNNVTVSGATTFSPALAQVPVGNFLAPTAGLPPIGYLTIPNGASLPTDAALYNPTFTPQTMSLAVSVVDPAGVETFLTPQLPITMQPFEFIVIIGFPIAPPATIPAYLGFPSKLRFTVTDPLTGLVVDYDEYSFVQG